MRTQVLLAVLGLLLAGGVRAWAGPPFYTDDPEPVAFRHWEVYLASIGMYGGGMGLFTTLPHIEVNYGVVPGVQLHMIAPMMAADPPGGPLAYGYGDTELGAKIRFVDEGRRRPEIGAFPLIELPSGDSARGLGAGFTQLFVPIWVQKDWGGTADNPAWTSYGGAGWWRNPGPGRRNWLFTGWELQRNFAAKYMLGGEVFHQGASAVGVPGGPGFNIGGQINFSDHRHLMGSVGESSQFRPELIWYAAYQWTF